MWLQLCNILIPFSLNAQSLFNKKERPRMYSPRCYLPPVDWNAFDNIRNMQNENRMEGILYLRYTS